MRLLGFDPGRDKCGIAVVGDNAQLLFHQVLPSEGVLAELPGLCDRFGVERVILGNQTTSKQWQGQLKAALPESLPIALVDERNSTLEARDRYWQMFPPKGLQRLIPQGLRIPPRPVDDIVAILLIERYLSAQRASERF